MSVTDKSLQGAEGVPPSLLNKLQTSIKFVGVMASTIKHMTIVSFVPDDDLQGKCRVAQSWGKSLLEHIGVTVRVEGEPPEWGCLHVANHRSYIDIIVILAYCPAVFLAKAGVQDWPIIGPAARLAGTVFVKRDQKDSRAAARETMTEQLGLGNSITVFPEGTTVAPPGADPLRPGAFYSAAEAGCPVVPLAIEYPRESDAWVNNETAGDHFFRVFNRPVEVVLRIGEPIRSDDGRELRDKAQVWIDEQLAELHEELHK